MSETTQKWSPAAKKAAQLVAEEICSTTDSPLLINHDPLADIISRETKDKELVEMLEVALNSAEQGIPPSLGWQSVTRALLSSLGGK